MTKVMRYENGKAIAGQVDAPFKVDWSDWINMTDAQKKGKKWLIENVPGAEGEIDAEILKELWRNPSPSSAFAEQYVTLSSSDYDVLLIIARHATTLDREVSVTVSKGMGASLCVGGPGSDNKPALFLRPVMYVSDTQLRFYNNTFTTSSGQSGENSGLIPTVIYGIKKTVKIKFDALAKDVSTLASKCMMSDGETSVEDKITALDSRTTVYHKNFSGITDANGNVKVHTFNNDYIPIFANSKTTNYMAYIIFWQADHSFYCHFMGPSGNLASGVSVSGDVYFIPFEQNNNPFPE